MQQSRVHWYLSIGCRVVCHLKPWWAMALMLAQKNCTDKLTWEH
jgi:hypothetical protein